MKKFWKQVRWFLIHGLFSAALYYGYIEGVQGAKNCAIAYAWFCIIASLLTLCTPVLKKAAEDGGLLSVPKWLNTIFDISVVVFFAWFGSWAISTFYLLHYFLLGAALTKIEEMRKETETTD
jgi:hypothetical protein